MLGSHKRLQSPRGVRMEIWCGMELEKLSPEDHNPGAPKVEVENQKELQARNWQSYTPSCCFC